MKEEENTLNVKFSPKKSLNFLKKDKTIEMILPRRIQASSSDQKKLAIKKARESSPFIPTNQEKIQNNIRSSSSSLLYNGNSEKSQIQLGYNSNLKNTKKSQDETVNIFQYINSKTPNKKNTSSIIEAKNSNSKNNDNHSSNKIPSSLSSKKTYLNNSNSGSIKSKKILNESFNNYSEIINHSLLSASKNDQKSILSTYPTKNSKIKLKIKKDSIPTNVKDFYNLISNHIFEKPSPIKPENSFSTSSASNPRLNETLERSFELSVKKVKSQNTEKIREVVRRSRENTPKRYINLSNHKNQNKSYIAQNISQISKDDKANDSKVNFSISNISRIDSPNFESVSTSLLKCFDSKNIDNSTFLKDIKDIPADQFRKIHQVELNLSNIINENSIKNKIELILNNDNQQKIETFEVIELDIEFSFGSPPTPYKNIKKYLHQYVMQNQIKFEKSEINIRDPLDTEKYYILDSNNAALLYYGELNNKGQKNGFGRCYSRNEVYIGQFLAGFKHGKGKYYYDSNEQFDGRWSQNLKSGEGKLYYSNNEIKMKGTWENDELSGNGIYYFKNGQKYEGKFKSNKMHGKGILFYSNGKVCYEGQWENGFKSGHFNWHDYNGKFLKIVCFEHDQEIDIETSKPRVESYEEQSLNQNNQNKGRSLNDKKFIIELKHVEMNNQMSSTTPKFIDKGDGFCNYSDKTKEKQKIQISPSRNTINLTNSDYELVASDYFGLNLNIAGLYINYIQEIHESEYWNNSKSHSLEYFLCNDYRRILIFDESFIFNLTNNTLNSMNWNYDAVKNITKKYIGKGFTIFDIYDRILFVVRDRELNWSLAEINCEEDDKFEFVIYDSNKVTRSKNNISLILCKYTEYEIKQKCYESLDYSVSNVITSNEVVCEDYSMYLMKIGNCELIAAEVDVHNHKHDSGIFTMGFLKDIVFDGKINFKLNDLSSMRNELKNMVMSYDNIKF